MQPDCWWQYYIQPQTTMKGKSQLGVLPSCMRTTHTIPVTASVPWNCEPKQTLHSLNSFGLWVFPHKRVSNYGPSKDFSLHFLITRVVASLEERSVIL